MRGFGRIASIEKVVFWSRAGGDSKGDDNVMISAKTIEGLLN